MSAPHAPTLSPVAGRPAPSRASASDVALTLLVVVSGPLLLVLGAVLMSGAETAAARLLRPELSTLQAWGAALEDQRQALAVGDLQAVEELIGLLCVAMGVLLSLLAAVSVIATALLALTRRVGIRRGTALLERLSPGFMRRALVVALGAQMAVMGTAAGVSSSVASQTTSPTATATTQQDGDQEGRGAGQGPERAPSGDSDLVADRQEAGIDPLFTPSTGEAEAPQDQPSPDSTSQPSNAPDAHPEATAPAGDDAGAAGSSDESSTRAEPAEDGQRAAEAAPSTSSERSDRLTGGEVRRAADEPEHVVVHSGDTLWSIAAEQLGPEATEAQIAAEWPRWYAANRDVIGDDPSQLLPGMMLEHPDEHSDHG